eukprot:6179568-Pleurochrysis_carterae.AAC.2
MGILQHHLQANRLRALNVSSAHTATEFWRRTNMRLSSSRSHMNASSVFFSPRSAAILRLRTYADCGALLLPLPGVRDLKTYRPAATGGVGHSNSIPRCAAAVCQCVPAPCVCCCTEGCT